MRWLVSLWKTTFCSFKANVAFVSQKLDKLYNMFKAIVLQRQLLFFLKTGKKTHFASSNYPTIAVKKTSLHLVRRSMSSEGLYSCPSLYIDDMKLC